MAYDAQIRCIHCGKAIPEMPEDATFEELLCDLCYSEYEERIEKTQKEGNKNGKSNEPFNDEDV